MSRRAAESPESSSSSCSSLPPDHVLNSGAVLFPGAFDQHGCPLVLFPADGLERLPAQLSKAQVVHFISYFLCLHKNQGREALVSVVADLRRATTAACRFIAETLLLLEFHTRTVHSVYFIQPVKKDAAKLMMKILNPSKGRTPTFKKVLLRDLPQLCSFVDRSQLPPSLGGYFLFCHRSWVAFVKEVDSFVQEFLRVVQRLPSCVAALQALATLPPPAAHRPLRQFCASNQEKFQQLRRDLGLDELLRHCERVVAKLRFPERDPSFHNMAGTALFTSTSADMLRNYSRITAAVDKVELLWQQAFSKACVQLQVFQLREDALRITEDIDVLLKKLQLHRVDVAKDEEPARSLAAEFEASFHTPAMALVRRAEGVVHSVAQTLPPGDVRVREKWVLDLDALKAELRSAVDVPLQTLRDATDFHRRYRTSSRWYDLVLSENFLQGLLSSLDRAGGQAPAWRAGLYSFLRRTPPPASGELLQLARLSNAVPDEELQRAGKQLSQRCLTLRKLLISHGAASFTDLQVALQWQYELLRSRQATPPQGDVTGATQPEGGCETIGPSISAAPEAEHVAGRVHLQASSPNRSPQGVGREENQNHTRLAIPAPAAGAKPPSLSSFDSGFDGAGSSRLESGGGREARERSSRPPQIHQENLCSASDTEDFDFGSVGNSSRASIQIIPKLALDSLNFEIKVQRSTTPPRNPWLSLPVDDLENSYTVTITQNPPAQQKDRKSPEGPRSGASRDQPTQTEAPAAAWPEAPRTRDWILQTQGRLEEPELSPIRNVLSSTITDGKDKSNCTADGVPTLLWDSYDLHDQNQDTLESAVMDLSLQDWDVREEEDLNEVQEILERADGILGEEESVLAQEAVLDLLLRSEGRGTRWELCDADALLAAMSSTGLTEAGVLGLGGAPGPVGREGLAPWRPEDAGPAAAGSISPRSGAELGNVRLLDELIAEENLKIHELRRREGGPGTAEPGPSGDRSSEEDGPGPPGVGEYRRTFRLKLEREKREVEKMERSLKEELARERKVERRGSTRRVVKCSALGKAGITEDQALCDGLLSDSRGRNAEPSTFTVPENSVEPDPSLTKGLPEVPHQEPPEETTPEVSDPPEDGPCPEEPDSDWTGHGGRGVTTPPEASAASSTCEDGVQPQSSADEETVEADPVDHGGSFKPEASLTPETDPGGGVFDPGGEPPPPPVPRPRKASVLVDGLEEGAAPGPFEEALVTPVPQRGGDDSLAKPGERRNELLDDSDAPVLCRGAAFGGGGSNNNNNNNHEALDRCASTDAGTPPQMDLNASHDSETLSLRDESLAPQPLPMEPPDGAEPTEPGGWAGPGGGGWARPARWAEPCEDSDHRLLETTTSLAGTQPQVDLHSAQSTDFKTPIVLDAGSGLMKAGLSDQDLPSVVFPTLVGLPKYEEIMNGVLQRESYVGHEAQHMRGVLALRHPIKNGVVCNWDDMEKIWHHTFQRLGVDVEEHPVVLTEAAMNPLANRQRTVELMFECFYVPLAYVAMQAVLALYAAGRCTGVVLDSGDGVSHSVPVFEGHCLPHAVRRLPLAGHDVTAQLKKLLQEKGVSMRTSAELEIVREMKEHCCRVALDYQAELRAEPERSEACYSLPDGQVVCLGTERFRAAEILFKPELIGREHYGMHESLYKSILSSDIDLRTDFLGNVVLSGGNTLLPGFPERLQRELAALVPSAPSGRVRVSSPADRDFSVWRGGAVLANLPSFAAAWISRQEYEEYGPQVVLRKCF